MAQSTNEEVFIEGLDFPTAEWQTLYETCSPHHPQQHAIPLQPQVVQVSPQNPFQTVIPCGHPCPLPEQQQNRWYENMNAVSSQSACPSPPTEQLGQIDAEWCDPRTGHYSSFGKIRPVSVMTAPCIPFDSLPPSPAIRKRHKKNDGSRKRKKIDPQLVKTMADHLSGTSGLEKIRWQSILQNTRGSEVGERETQRRVKEVEILWLRLFGGDLRDLMRYVLDEHLDFVVKYVQETLCTSKRRHKKVRENLFRVLLDVKRREDYESRKMFVAAAGVPGASSRFVNGALVSSEVFGMGWLAPPTPEIGDHSDS